MRAARADGTAAIVDLDACADLSAKRVGGKAATLARLRREGIETPPGFVVTTRVDREARGRGGKLAEPARRELAERWRAAGWSKAVVRSSGVLEDGAHASLAGQLETVLDVRDEAGLLRAVEHVQASARSERVRCYLGRRLPDTDPQQLLCACLVQPLLDPECAGVCFSVDPATGDRERLLVECVRGLGETLVAGAVRPERHVMKRPSLEPIESRPAEGEETALLPPDLLRAVAETALRIEGILGVPQDVEWAIVEGRVVVLQARGITAIAPDRTAREAALATEVERLHGLYGAGPDLWTNLFAAELLPHPTRASLELLREMGAPGTGGVPLAFQHDLGLGRSRQGIVADTVCGNAFVSLASLERMLADWGVPIRLKPPRTEWRWSRLDPAWIRPRWGRLTLELPRLPWRALRVALRVRALLRDGPERFRRVDLPAIEREVERGNRQLERLPDPELLEELDAARAWCAGPGRRIWERGNLSALLCFGILALRTRRWLDDGDAAIASALVRGAPDNATLAVNEAIHDLGDVARDSGEDSAAFEDALASFLSRFGQRATTELELSDPRWREDPSPIRAAVKTLLDSAGTRPDPAPPDLQPHLARLSARRGRKLRRAVSNARRSAFLRETPKFHYLRRLEQLRGCYLEVGRRAAQRGALDELEQVFQLGRDELEPALAGGPAARALGEAAKRRRHDHSLLRDHSLPQFFRWERLEDVLAERMQPSAPAASDRTLRGEGVSPGRASGRARIVRDPSDAGHLGPDAVLVAPRTDPGWTPLFLSVRAVVVETGSAISHASIVAREYGLPAVVNVERATQRIPEGAWIWVDGREGRVEIEELPPEAAGGGLAELGYPEEDET